LKYIGLWIDVLKFCYLPSLCFWLWRTNGEKNEL